MRNHSVIHQVESLESRRYMAMDLIVNGSNDADDISIFQDRYRLQVRMHNKSGWHDYVIRDPSTDMNIIINAKGGADTVRVDRLRFGWSVKIDAGDGNDRVTVGGWSTYGMDVDGPVTVIGGAGNDQLTVDDSNGNTPQFKDIYRVASNYIGWGGTNTGNGTFDQWEVTFDDTMEYAKLKGTNENSTINILSSAAGRTVNIEAGDGSNVINVGGGDLDSNMKGTVSIQADGGTDSLLIDDTLDEGDDAYLLSSTRLRKAGAADFHFTGVNTTSLLANDGKNIIQVDSIANPTTVRGGLGDDAFQIGLGEWKLIRHELTLDGQGGNDSTVVDDSESTANAYYQVSPSLVSKSTPNSGKIKPLSMQSVALQGGRGSDLFSVKPGLGAELQIRGGGQLSSTQPDVLQFSTTEIPLHQQSQLGSTYIFAHARPVKVSGIERLPAYGGSIGGMLFNDRNGDGRRDPLLDSALANRTVFIDLDNDKVRDANEPQTQTNGNGKYLFLGLAAGTYKVRQVLASNWTQTTPSNGYGQNVVLAHGEQRSDIHFGSRQIA